MGIAGAPWQKDAERSTRPIITFLRFIVPIVWVCGETFGFTMLVWEFYDVRCQKQVMNGRSKLVQLFKGTDR